MSTAPGRSGVDGCGCGEIPTTAMTGRSCTSFACPVAGVEGGHVYTSGGKTTFQRHGFRLGWPDYYNMAVGRECVAVSGESLPDKHHSDLH